MHGKARIANSNNTNKNKNKNKKSEGIRRIRGGRSLLVFFSHEVKGTLFDSFFAVLLGVLLGVLLAFFGLWLFGFWVLGAGCVSSRDGTRTECRSKVDSM